MDEVNTDSVICSKKTAQEAFDNKDYVLATELYMKLWENSMKNDSLILSRLGQSLRKIGKSQEFIVICRTLLQINEHLLDNKFVNDILCWCLYECHVKSYDVKDISNFEQFLKSATFIRKNSCQKDADIYFHNPYVLTMFKVVKVYSSKASPNYDSVIEWLGYLNPQILSDEIFSITDRKGKERELASPKEFYYYRYTKALEKTEQYSECIKLCEKALSEIKKFHYRNKVWITSRLYFSKCMVQDDLEKSLQEFESLAEKENYWFMFHKLSQISFRFNKMEQSLFFACKAFSARFEEEKMVNLMLDLGTLWEANNNKDNAIIFYQASAYYRQVKGWKISEELKYNIYINDLDISKAPNVKLLKQIAKNYVLIKEGSANKFNGIINNFLTHGKSGFIIPEIGKDNIYFNVRNVQGVVQRGTKVIYELSKDRKNRPIAINILVVEE